MVCTSDAFQAKRIGLFEWYYRAVGADVDFLAQAPVDDDRALRLRTWNAQTLLELADCDLGEVPTEWQRQQFQTICHPGCVIREGIDWNTLVHKVVEWIKGLMFAERSRDRSAHLRE